MVLLCICVRRTLINCSEKGDRQKNKPTICDDATQLISFIIVSTKACMLGCKSDREHAEEHSEEHSEEEAEEEEEEAVDAKEDDSSSQCSTDESKEDLVDIVWRSVWPHLNCYLLPVDDYTRWFLMDEVRTCTYMLIYTYTYSCTYTYTYTHIDTCLSTLFFSFSLISFDAFFIP
jgi:hypothetical protein